MALRGMPSIELGIESRSEKELQLIGQLVDLLATAAWRVVPDAVEVGVSLPF